MFIYNALRKSNYGLQWITDYGRITVTVGLRSDYGDSGITVDYGDSAFYSTSHTVWITVTVHSIQPLIQSAPLSSFTTSTAKN